MNDLVKSVSLCERAQVPNMIMAVCRSITPYFYKGLSKDDVKAEKLSIEMLTAGIDNKTLSVMCEMAIKRYPLARAENGRTYFDINYLLTFYKEAFNKVWCEDISVEGCSYAGGSYDKASKILTEVWKSQEDGREVFVRQIMEPAARDWERLYSDKFYAAAAVKDDCDIDTDDI